MNSALVCKGHVNSHERGASSSSNRNNFKQRRYKEAFEGGFFSNTGSH